MSVHFIFLLRQGGSREGMLENLSLGSYLLMAGGRNWTGGQLRK